MTTDCQKAENAENRKEFMDYHFDVLVYDFVKIMRCIVSTYDKNGSAVGIEF